MKRRIFSLIIAALLSITVCASASELTNGTYTDAVSMITQDSLLDYNVLSEEAEAAPEIAFLQPNEESMALLQEIFQFVWRDQNRPIEFFDEETQNKIRMLVPDTNVEELHMTEFMSLSASGAPVNDVTIQMLLDVDYHVDQLVVVILGYLEDGEYRWFPYLGEVPLTGLIEFVVPAEDYHLFTNRSQIIYQVMSVRVGPRGDVVEEKHIEEEKKVTPSKSAGDITRVITWKTTDGTTMDDTFGIYLVDKTNEMNAEILNIASFLSETNENGNPNAVIDWFPQEIVNEMQLLAGQDIDLSTMIAYDIVAVMSKDYKDTYGDVAAEIRFASAYAPEFETIVMLGFPLTEEELAAASADEASVSSRFKWYCLNAQSMEAYLEIVFKQLVIPQMELEPAMLIVMSEPLDTLIQE